MPSICRQTSKFCGWHIDWTQQSHWQLYFFCHNAQRLFEVSIVGKQGCVIKKTVHGVSNKVDAEIHIRGLFFCFNHPNEVWNRVRSRAGWQKLDWLA